MWTLKWTISLSIVTLLGLSGTGKEPEVPEGFPPVTYPDDNQYSEERYELGRRLFYDAVLSVDSSISCASCHLPEQGFSDRVALSPGVKGRPGVRNAPSLANVAYHPYFLREGSVPTLEQQVLVPIQEKNEMAHNIVAIADRLMTDSSYVNMSIAAYNRPPDAFVITRALATFERTLLSGNSRFDQLQRKEPGVSFSQDEQLGMELFFSSRTDCSVCHAGFNFTDYRFANNGLDSAYADIGRMRFTGNESDRSLFKVPSLRNAETTAPYMHDGRLTNLEEVIHHYNTGGYPHPNKDPLVRPLNLSAEEEAALVAFLKTLTDTTFVSAAKATVWTRN